MMNYNKDHIEQIVNYLWEDEMTHFQEMYEDEFEENEQLPENLEDFSWDKKEEVGRFLNLCLRYDRTSHIFYTIVQLHYQTL